MNKNKYDELSKKIAKAKGEEEVFDAERAKGASIGMRIASEMIAALLVGFILGYTLDEFFDTSPILLIVFILLGSGAGLLAVYRLAVRDSEE